MATVLRFARFGGKKNPFYHLVATNSRSPRNSKFLEKLGTFNPMLAKDNPARVVLNEERVKYWMSVGAQLSERVEKMLHQKGLAKLSVDYTQKPKRAVKNPEKFGAAPAAGGEAPAAAAPAEAAANPEAAA